MFSILSLLIGNAANLLNAAAYSVRNIMTLRILVVVAAVFDIIYTARVVSDPWAAGTDMMWNGVFILINAYQLWVLYRDSRFSYSAEERDIYTRIFHSLSPTTFRKLLSIAEWRDIDDGTTLTSEGETVQNLYLIYRGLAVVLVGEHIVAHCGENNFIGEMSFLTGKSATASVRSAALSRCVVWTKADLQALVDKNDDVLAGLQMVFSRNLVDKIGSNNSNVFADTLLAGKAKDIPPPIEDKFEY
ncbi:MAG: cyclic nucleotide-binding domain-containing protein [Ignavibacteria bacterium]|nr:cyclic nucleotide-binding domain-containing protein [Ignavibacteria bacterium]